MKENSLPRGLRNNNPLNIRKGNNWQGERQPQTDKEFEEFKSLEDGFRAAFIIIRNYLQKRPPINTPRAIIRRWAPPSENNTSAYLDYVCRRAVLNPDEPLKWPSDMLKWSRSNPDRNKLCMLVLAMAEYENGIRAKSEFQFSYGRIDNAFAMACR